MTTERRVGLHGWMPTKRCIQPSASVLADPGRQGFAGAGLRPPLTTGSWPAGRGRGRRRSLTIQRHHMCQSGSSD